MDKILNELEKQRRAENIYNSRRNGINYFQEQDNNKKNKSIYKLLFQILLIVNVTLYIFCMQNQTYIFKDEFIADVNVFIENVKMRARNEEIFMENVIENEVDTNLKNENVVTLVENMVAVKNNENKVTESIKNMEESVVEVQKTEAEKEIEALIGMYQFKDPIGEIGIITSNFGDRESDNINVSEYHTGIDIGAPLGSDIKSSVTGIVTLVSSSGDYRKTSKS